MTWERWIPPGDESRRAKLERAALRRQLANHPDAQRKRRLREVRRKHRNGELSFQREEETL